MGVAIRLPFTAPRVREDRRKDRDGKRRRAPKPQVKPAAAKGATRRQQVQVAPAKVGFGWLNRLLILIGVGVVSAAGLQAWIYLESLPVEHIRVSGEMEHTRAVEVQDLVNPTLGGGFLGTDLQALQDQLEGLPWIYQASVRRVWPNVLEIHVVEQLPIARWGETGFINHHGEVFRPTDAAAVNDLPLLDGPEGAAGELMHNYLRLVDLLAPLGLGVAQLTVDERGEMVAVLNGGQSLVIGGRDFLERMQRFGVVYRAELASRMDEVARIDLRYQRGMAVAFREVASGDEQQQNNGNRA